MSDELGWQPWQIGDLTPMELHAGFLYAHPEENR